MTKQSNGVDLTFVASTDLSGSQFKFVTLQTDGTIQITPDDGLAIGVLQNKPAVGQAGTVRVGGVSKLKLGGTVATGAKASSGALGVAKAADAASNVAGIMVNGGVVGDTGSILLGYGGGAVFV